MKFYQLHKEQVIKRPIEEVFAFFEKPENLAKITPPQLAFEILTPAPLEMRRGSLIDYTVKVAGLRVRWTTIITAYDPPHKFVDEQLKGPYSYWHHTHTFKEVPEGTLIADDVRYLLPFGFLGQIAHALKVKRDLEKIFAYRSLVIDQHFDHS